MKNVSGPNYLEILLKSPRHAVEISREARECAHRIRHGFNLYGVLATEFGRNLGKKVENDYTDSWSFSEKIE
jgi:hypothetical protein